MKNMKKIFQRKSLLSMGIGVSFRNSWYGVWEYAESWLVFFVEYSFRWEFDAAADCLPVL